MHGTKFSIRGYYCLLLHHGIKKNNMFWPTESSCAYQRYKVLKYIAMSTILTPLCSSFWSQPLKIWAIDSQLVSKGYKLPPRMTFVLLYCVAPRARIPSNSTRYQISREQVHSETLSSHVNFECSKFNLLHVCVCVMWWVTDKLFPQVMWEGWFHIHLSPFIRQYSLSASKGTVCVNTAWDSLPLFLS